MQSNQKKGKKRRWKYILIFLLSFIAIGYFVGDHYAKKYGFRNIWHFVKVYSSNSSKASNAHVETLKIKISKADFKKLENLREKHFEKGLIENEEGDYVDAKLNWNGKKIDAKLRLKGHMTDHLQDKKWSFRVKTKGGDAFMGMKVFSLQHPGTRNYIYEWIYHQMMKQEKIVSLRYDFIKVYINDENWGIYALEEHFAQELVKNNQRIKGPLIRFNPDLYWVYRSQENDHINIETDYSGVQSTFPEAYDNKNVVTDSTLIDRYSRALNLIEQVKQRKLKVAQAFDIGKLATFHAIVDLVGGHHSLDWSDVKYYYNPEADLLEPVAYESFSVTNTWQLGGAYKCHPSDSNYIDNWHDILFSDSAFFALYIKALYRVSDKKWLDGFFKKIDKDLQAKLAVLYKEFAYREFDLKQYGLNQKNIMSLLENPDGLLIYYDGVGQNQLLLKIGNVGPMPYNILSIDIDSLRGIRVTPVMIDAGRKNEYVKFVQVRLNTPVGIQLSASTKVNVHYSIPGSGKIHTTKMIPVKLWDKLEEERKDNFRKFGFMHANKTTITIDPGRHVINEKIYIPEGYTVNCGPSTSFEMGENGGIVSRSPLLFTGDEEERVSIVLNGTKQAISIINCERSSFSNTDFVNPKTKNGNALRVFESTLDIKNCNFSGNLDEAIRATNSHVAISNTYLGGISGSALEAHYSDVAIVATEFRKIGKDAIKFIGCKASIQQTKIFDAGGKAISAQEVSTVTVSWSLIQGCNTAVEARDFSTVNITGIELNENETGLKASKKGDVFGPATINVKKLKEKNNKVLKEAEKKSVINIQP